MCVSPLSVPQCAPSGRSAPAARRSAAASSRTRRTATGGTARAAANPATAARAARPVSAAPAPAPAPQSAFSWGNLGSLPQSQDCRASGYLDSI